jgi:hypothetical protein
MYRFQITLPDRCHQTNCFNIFKLISVRERYLTRDFIKDTWFDAKEEILNPEHCKSVQLERSKCSNILYTEGAHSNQSINHSMIASSIILHTEVAP